MSRQLVHTSKVFKNFFNSLLLSHLSENFSKCTTSASRKRVNRTAWKLKMEAPTNSKKTSNSQPIVSNNESKCESKTLEEFTEEGFKKLIEATKRSNRLPLGKSRDLYESFPSFHTVMGNQSEFVLSILSKVLKYFNLKGNIQRRSDEDKFEMIVDANDNLLENVGTALDELSGIRRNPELQFMSRNKNLVSGSWNKSNKLNNKKSSLVLNEILSKTKNIEKPQLNFEDRVNNNQNEPFEPKIKYKYNMLKPLALIEEMSEEGICQFSHPYEFELNKFKPSDDLLQLKPPIMFENLNQTPFKFISKPQEVSSMVETLEKCTEIAVDLEHHSYRSFQGFTCLMQISTRKKDYVIDTISLRSHLQDLNKVFTNPSILKVFHGGDQDIVWLQKDLGLYVVNMFDTYQAAKLLGFPKLSLAYLLMFYCNVEAQKHFQLADWRIRPLPKELLTYAREDTHYLLYIYDNLRNSLIETANGQKNLLETVISESTRICLKRYIKPLYDPEGYLDIYNRSKKLFDNRQKFALQKLYEWRDSIARMLDESYHYVLPNHMMLNISEVLPREAQGILACCNPIPTPVRHNLLDLHQIILKAREEPLIKPVLDEQQFYKFTTASNSLDNPLQCPHDLNHEGEFRDDLPVLFATEGELKTDIKNLTLTTDELYNRNPIIDMGETKVVSNKSKSSEEEDQGVLLTPYCRYKLAKKYAESVEAKNLFKKEKHDLEKVNLIEDASDGQVSINTLKRKIDSELEINTKIAKTSKNKSLDEEIKNKTNDDVSRVQTNERKRKLLTDDNLTLNKLKKMEKANLIKNSKLDSSEDPPNEVKTENKKVKKEKKSAHSNPKEEKFQPFDYKSVDYGKYHTSAEPPKKRSEKRRKGRRKGGKKNFKISV